MAGIFYPLDSNYTSFSGVAAGGVYTQTDVDHLHLPFVAVSQYDLTAAQAVVADVNWFVTDTHCKVGAYTVANAAMPGTPACARNVTVTVTADGNVDTPGTVLVTGTDLADAVISETLTPLAGSTVQGTYAFKTVTSIVGAGWVIDGNNDHVTFGFGDLIGLPDRLTATTRVLTASLATVMEATRPTVTFSTTVLALNTVDLSSALNGTAVAIYYRP